jgi:hypothetical protein
MVTAAVAAVTASKYVGGGAAQFQARIGRSCGDASRRREAIGWSPRISWERSIEDLWRSVSA